MARVVGQASNSRSSLDASATPRCGRTYQKDPFYAPFIGETHIRGSTHDIHVLTWIILFYKQLLYYLFYMFNMFYSYLFEFSYYKCTKIVHSKPAGCVSVPALSQSLTTTATVSYNPWSDGYNFDATAGNHAGRTWFLKFEFTVWPTLPFLFQTMHTGLFMGTQTCLFYGNTPIYLTSTNIIIPSYHRRLPSCG